MANVKLIIGLHNAFPGVPTVAVTAPNLRPVLLPATEAIPEGQEATVRHQPRLGQPPSPPQGSVRWGR